MEVSKVFKLLVAPLILNSLETVRSQGELQFKSWTVSSLSEGDSVEPVPDLTVAGNEPQRGENLATTENCVGLRENLYIAEKEGAYIKKNGLLESQGEFQPRSKKLAKRQVVKIPSDVKTIKVLRKDNKSQMKPKNTPHVRTVMNFHRKRPKRNNGKRQPAEYIKEYNEPKQYGTRGWKTKKPKFYIKEVSPEEFYSDENFHQRPSPTIEEIYTLEKRPRNYIAKGSRKYQSADEGGDDLRYLRSYVTKNSEENDYEGKDYLKHYYDVKGSSVRSNSEHAHDDKVHGASSLHIKQVPAPNLTPDLMREPKHNSLGGDEKVSAFKYTLQNVPSTRDMQGVFQQIYTSHNPNVMTNLGLNPGEADPKSGHDYSSLDTRPPNPPSSVSYAYQSTVGNEHLIPGVPVGANGLQIVQPPQFGLTSKHRVTIATPPEGLPTNPKATIRDILQQDCPDYEILGFCSSPPRYPTVQIAAMVTKCPELQEVMNAPVPLEPRDDLTSFGTRSDNDLDIIFDNEANGTFTGKSNGFPEQSWLSWSRSGPESETACNSEYAVIEPGYAKEVTSGKWFVVVQNSESSLQKITMDTCSNPGKPCSGLSGLKCSRNRNSSHGVKSTRCIQRYTHQRLLSWDPEAPQKCPQIRIFRFPTACICHLGLM